MSGSKEQKKARDEQIQLARSRGADSLRIMVFRSTSKTAVHELSVAIKGVAARG